MENHNRVIKVCGICGNKRVYNEYHSLFNPCKTSEKIHFDTIKL